MKEVRKLNRLWSFRQWPHHLIPIVLPDCMKHTHPRLVPSENIVRYLSGPLSEDRQQPSSVNCRLSLQLLIQTPPSESHPTMLASTYRFAPEAAAERCWSSIGQQPSRQGSLLIVQQLHLSVHFLFCNCYKARIWRSVEASRVVIGLNPSRRDPAGSTCSSLSATNPKQSSSTPFLFLMFIWIWV